MNFSWLRLALLLIIVNHSFARPKDGGNTEHKTLENSQPQSATATEVISSPTQQAAEGNKKVIEDIAVVARAVNDDPSLSPSVAKVTDQLIDTIGQMVEKDMRTPPKLKEKIDAESLANNRTETTPAVDKVEANGKFQLTTDISEGKANSVKKDEAIKGIAVPVIMDEDLETPPKKLQKIPNVTKPPKDDSNKKKVTSTLKPAKEPPTTTPSSGLSTWILLSDNRDATTPSTPKNKKPVATTTKKPNKTQATTVKLVTSKPTTKKTTPKPEIKRTEPVSALEAMVNNQKKNITRTSQKKKGESVATKENDHKQVVTIPPAILIETTEISTTDSTNTEATVETTTKRKKTSSKKRKKNKNRRKKPAEKTGAEQEIKDVAKQPKQPVGAQLYNFLSREIMPTVGLGLVGVLVTAGLAGLLGYNPFVGTNVPVRRTYETQHGYSPNNNYYTYNSEYGDTDGGQNEEVLFREVLSGMPADSRYSMPPSETAYPESQLYNSQEQAYDAVKSTGPSPDKKTEDPGDTGGYSQMYGSSYEAYSNKESVSKYPVYSTNTGGSFAYPETRTTTEKFKASSKYSNSGTIEKQPEALYRVSGDYTSEDETAGSVDSETSWHRIGSPMDYGSQISHVEPGPRRLDLEKMTENLTKVNKRSKRSPEGFIARLVRRSKEIAEVDNDQDNEIDVDDVSREKIMTTTTTEMSLTENPVSESSSSPTKENSPATEETQEPSLTEPLPNDGSTTVTTEAAPSLMDVVRRLAQFKLRLGLNFLKTTAETFYRYLDGVQKSVEDSMANDTSFSSMRNTWLGRDDSSQSDDEIRVREKRFQRNVDVIDDPADGRNESE